MKKVYLFLTLITLFTISSCIEIVDDISINQDGSGTFKYNINLSSSKVKISSLLALDSLDGKKIPTRAEIQSKIDHFINVFEGKEGIKNVQMGKDFGNYIFRLQCDFKSVKLLQEAIKSTVKSEVKGNEDFLGDNVDWLIWKEGSFERSVPEFSIKKVDRLNEKEINLLKQGSYISITRFDRLVKDFSNKSAVMAKNKMAVMLKSNAYSLSQNPSLLENTIYLSPLKP